MKSRSTASALSMIAMLGLAGMHRPSGPVRRFASRPRGNKYAGMNSLPPSAYANTPRLAPKSSTPRSQPMDSMSFAERGARLARAPKHKDGNRLGNRGRKMIAGLVTQ